MCFQTSHPQNHFISVLHLRRSYIDGIWLYPWFCSLLNCFPYLPLAFFVLFCFTLLLSFLFSSNYSSHSSLTRGLSEAGFQPGAGRGRPCGRRSAQPSAWRRRSRSSQQRVSVVFAPQRFLMGCLRMIYSCAIDKCQLLKCS